MAEIEIHYEETGVVRPPKRGEWFVVPGKAPQQARFDFSQQSFPIVREVIVRHEESEVRKAHEAEPPNA